MTILAISVKSQGNNINNGLCDMNVDILVFDSQFSLFSSN
ncbi:hypothetical protein SynPROS91_00851 [Synechococcus sp. PROS-9-1]|nr:hypothetical protein SynPROS91_00851 [Synechococcus sp. PROS-9-1]